MKNRTTDMLQTCHVCWAEIRWQNRELFWDTTCTTNTHM